MPGTSKLPGADVDAWVRQSQTLADLAEFVKAHGPATTTPLPVLCWKLGVGRAISAELPTFQPDAQRLATLDAYAEVLGAVVTSSVKRDRTLYAVRGRIGRPEGSEHKPRISAVIRATVWRELADDADGGA